MISMTSAGMTTHVAHWLLGLFYIMRGSNTLGWNQWVWPYISHESWSNGKATMLTSHFCLFLVQRFPRWSSLKKTNVWGDWDSNAICYHYRVSPTLLWRHCFSFMFPELSSDVWATCLFYTLTNEAKTADCAGIIKKHNATLRSINTVCIRHLDN